MVNNIVFENEYLEIIENSTGELIITHKKDNNNSVRITPEFCGHFLVRPAKTETKMKSTYVDMNDDFRVYQLTTHGQDSL